MKRAIFFLSAFLPVFVFSQDVDPFADLDPSAPVQEEVVIQYRVNLEYIELPLEKMAALMASPAAADEAKLKKSADALVQKGEAKLIEFQSVICQSGTEATSESVHEIIYPTEYEPAEIPNTVDASLTAEQIKELAIGPTPTSFDTRKVGSVFEVELTGLGDVVDLKLSPEIITHTGTQIWSTWKNSKGEAHVQMPDFYTLRFKGSLSVKVGQPALVTSLTPHDESGSIDPSRKILVFVKVQKLEVK